jgi:uncharacterized protein GlcG (DUF336 family)
MLMSLRIVAVAGLAAMLAVPTLVIAVPAGAQPLQHKDLSYDIAKTIATTAVETCRSQGYAVSAHVVGRDGETIVALRGDGAGPHTFENSRRKAYTARTFRIPTAEYAQRYEKDPTVRQQATLPGVIAIAGGLPIKIGDEVVGGAGVSGSPSGHDEPCVQAGLDKVKDQLK